MSFKIEITNIQAWLKRKTDFLLKKCQSHDRFYSQRMTIPLDLYDTLNPVTFIHQSTVLRLVSRKQNKIFDKIDHSFQGTIPLLTLPENIEREYIKCSDDHDKIISNRFNSTYRLTVIFISQPSQRKFILFFQRILSTIRMC